MILRIIFCMSVIFSNMSFANSQKVVVIGGGIAGLTAASRLQQEGMDVHLYEARNRIGGRIFTAKMNGRIAELGGQNITDGGEIQISIHDDRVYLNGQAVTILEGKWKVI
jgi:monoamine oxidase